MKEIRTQLRSLIVLLCFIYPAAVHAQCDLELHTTVTESRCKATGTISIEVTGGSGQYNYRVTGGASPIITSTSEITGLAPGNYSVEAKDLNSGCTVSATNVIITGNYQDPRFVLSGTELTCINGSDGSIAVSDQQYGASPFIYSIVAPSSYGVGTSNSTGVFDHLPAGDYYIRLADSCGGIQTRIYTIAAYNWWIDSKSVTKFGCDSADVVFTVKDSRGNSNVSGSQFDGFSYGVSVAPGDTVWSPSRSFRFALQHARTIALITRDACGNVKTSNWTDAQPNLAASVSINSRTCSGFTATVTGQQNLSNPQYCLYDNSNNQISCNNTGVFTNVPYGSYCIKIEDACYDTLITRCFSEAQPVPSVNGTVSISNVGCSTFTATITGQTNLSNPQYCLYDNNNTQIDCNTSGVFSNISFGSYCIKITDGCTGTVLTRCFSKTAPVPAVYGSVNISGQNCDGFTAKITGQSNLTNPQYCLYDENNNQVECNSTGSFNVTGYGSYCIKITNNASCYDTTIQRCFTVGKPVPSASASVSISNKVCSGFAASITGKTNLNNAQYCLYDDNNNQIDCNSTGQFDNIPYGSYCIRITNDAACYDTSFSRCFTVSKPQPSVSASVSVSNKDCDGFRASVSGQSGLNNPQYCLYNSNDDQLDCNTTGVFDNIPYGSYCIKITNDPSCYDTVISRCFSVSKPVPSVGASVSISNKTCSGFTASISGQSNLNNPQYCIYDGNNNQLICNATGVFTNLAYGSYTIQVTNDAACYDTVIQRSFSVSAVNMHPSVNASASCNIGTTNLSVSWTSTGGPYTVQVFNPGGAVVYNQSSGSTSTSITGLAGLPAGLQYKVLLTDACGNKDSAMVTPQAASVTRSINANSKCPGGEWLNGSGDLVVHAEYSQGWISPRIIKKNNISNVINYSSSGGGNYTFSNLEPAEYIVEYSLQSCSTKLYDTFELASYSFPNLAQSAVYQCNNNNFSVSAAVTGGLSPFSYEIIGSVPESPAIVANAQSSPVFSIDNGTTYGLVRLRAIDACGNATINDASVLPLANTTISANSNCFYNDIVLIVDTIPNATYTWYRKTGENDSVQLAAGQSYTIPYLLPSDTGTYIAHVSVNSGCLTRVSYFDVTGICSSALAASNISFAAQLLGQEVQLQWQTGKDFGASIYNVERSLDGKHFELIGQVKASGNDAGRRAQYYFADQSAPDGQLYYRLRMVRGEKFSYTKVVPVQKLSLVALQILPNPADAWFDILFSKGGEGSYSMMLMSPDGRSIASSHFRMNAGGRFRVQRPVNATAGVYYINLLNNETLEKTLLKVIFR